MKRALLISYYFPPAGGPGVQRIRKFVQYLPDFGWMPMVLTVNIDSSSSPTFDPGLTDCIDESVDVVRTRAWDPYAWYARLQGRDKELVVGIGFANDGGTNRRTALAKWVRGNVFLPDARIGWLPYAVRAARQILHRNRFDIVMTTGPPHSAHLVGRRLTRSMGIPWVVDMRDPWTDTYYASELPQSRLARKIDKRMEASVLSEADAVVSVSKGMEACMRSKATLRSYKTITNGFDPYDIPSPLLRNENGNSLVLAHFGTYTKWQHAPGMVRALARFAQKRDIVIAFTGRVDEMVLHAFKHADLGKQVHVLPYKPYAGALTDMTASDILFVSAPRLDRSRGVLPVKLFEYLGIGKPILALARPHGELASILEHTRGGKAFDHEDDEGIEDYLEGHAVRIANGVPPNAPDPKAIQAYDRRKLTGKLAELFDKVSQAV